MFELIVSREMFVELKCLLLSGLLHVEWESISLWKLEMFLKQSRITVGTHLLFIMNSSWSSRGKLWSIKKVCHESFKSEIHVSYSVVEKNRWKPECKYSYLWKQKNMIQQNFEDAILFTIVLNFLISFVLIMLKCEWKVAHKFATISLFEKNIGKILCFNSSKMIPELLSPNKSHLRYDLGYWPCLRGFCSFTFILWFSCDSFPITALDTKGFKKLNWRKLLKTSVSLPVSDQTV